MGADADAGLPDESAGVQGGPGVEGGLGLRERGPADLGVVPAGNGIEVLPARLELPDDQDLVGDVEQRLVGYGAGAGRLPAGRGPRARGRPLRTAEHRLKRRAHDR